MGSWMNLGQQFKMNSKRFPNKVALKDRSRIYTYSEINDRVNSLVSGFFSLGLSKGDKIAVLMENCIEFVELYLATAKAGLIIVPINFRLHHDEIAYIINDSGSNLVCVGYEFVDFLNKVRIKIKTISNYVVIGKDMDGYLNYNELINNSYKGEPDVVVDSKDIWIIMYTSGTTGKPKGVVRSHESHISFYLLNGIDFGFNTSDICMNVMPLCHINSVFFTFIFIYIGAIVYIHPAQLFNSTEIFRVIEKEKITFISLIPTHYNLILSNYESLKKFDVTSIRKLLCSSSPVRKKTKLKIMETFPGVELYEGYGSTEAGIVTILKPEDQINKLGSIGYESLGTDEIKIFDELGNVLDNGEIGELYSKGPMMFDFYYNMPRVTKKSFKGNWFSAGDMALRDSDGYYMIVDRKDNMIISGGEHVYPSEVEEIISTYPGVYDVAVVGLYDDKWGEKVVAIIVPNDFYKLDISNLKKWCKDRLASYKCPKDILFIDDKDMPRTTTGKILHRVLREQFKI